MTTTSIPRFTIAIDDIGMLPDGQAAAEAPTGSAGAAYEHRSLIVTSNLGNGVTPLA